MRAQVRPTLSARAPHAAPRRRRRRGRRASTVLDTEAELLDRFEAVRHHRIDASRIRVHGDYHLGQVLHAGRDFVIIDFEGEPSRSPTERRIKRGAARPTSPASSARSSTRPRPGCATTQARGLVPPDQDDALETRGPGLAALGHHRVPRRRTSSEADGHPVRARRPGRRPRVLLTAYVLDKALYEVRYDLDHRPDWAPIPLRGIVQLLDAEVGGPSSSTNPRGPTTASWVGWPSDLGVADLVLGHPGPSAPRRHFRWPGHGASALRGRRSPPGLTSARAAHGSWSPGAVRPVEPVVVVHEGEPVRGSNVRAPVVGGSERRRRATSTPTARAAAVPRSSSTRCPRSRRIAADGREHAVRTLAPRPSETQPSASATTRSPSRWVAPSTRPRLHPRSPPACRAPRPGRATRGASSRRSTSCRPDDIYGPTVGDLTRLGSWVEELGGRRRHPCPILATYLSQPYDPSPYAPVESAATGTSSTSTSRPRRSSPRASGPGPCSTTRVTRRAAEQIRTADLFDHRGPLHGCYPSVLDELADDNAWPPPPPPAPTSTSGSPRTPTPSTLRAVPCRHRPDGQRVAPRGVFAGSPAGRGGGPAPSRATPPDGRSGP